MKPNTIYIPHEITDEGSLPKVEGWYFVFWDESAMGNACTSKDKYYFIDSYKEYWIKWFTFWLEEKELPSDEEIEKRINEGLYINSNDYVKGLFRLGVNYILSLLK